MTDSFLPQEQLRRNYGLHFQWTTKFAGKCKALCTLVSFFKHIKRYLQMQRHLGIKKNQNACFLMPDFFFLEHSCTICILQGQNDKCNHKKQISTKKCVHALILKKWLFEIIFQFQITKLKYFVQQKW